MLLGTWLTGRTHSYLPSPTQLRMQAVQLFSSTSLLHWDLSQEAYLLAVDTQQLLKASAVHCGGLVWTDQ